MKSDVLYISSACSNKKFKSLEKERRYQPFLYGMPAAANKFHNLVMQGFVKNECSVKALVGLPVSPKSHNKKIWKKEIEIDNNVEYVNLPFINFPIIKYFCIGFSCIFNIFKWKGTNKIIIYDAAYVSIIPFITFANFFKKAKVIAIFSDVYNYMYDVDAKNTNYNILCKISRILMKCCYKKCYGYVFLSEQMNTLINKNNKPYCVIEGVADTNNIVKKQPEKINKKIIMYAGALRKEYGLEILLKGFRSFQNSDVELWIYGLGDYLDEIKKMELVDKRIKYQGIKDYHEIVDIERQVTLLVNPRPSKLEFTQYSFPSKLMEYMSSGTAVLTTKLPTIPKEYYNYLFFIEDETERGVAKALDKIFKMNKRELQKQGENAKQFIKTKKTEVIQIKKILDM